MSADVWGDLYRDHVEGRHLPHVVVRDDGHETRFADAGIYFSVPDEHAAILASVRSPVLELACGAGRYARYLEERGHHVVAVDASPGAIDVCRRRGCADARLMDIGQGLPAGPFATVLLMGVCLGIGPTEPDQVALFRRIRKATTADAAVIGTTLDPRVPEGVPHTEEEAVHHRYQKRNLRAGLPIGLIRLRLEYRGVQGPWFPVWLMTPEEVARTAAAAGWRVSHRERHGVLDTYVLAKSGT